MKLLFENWRGFLNEEKVSPDQAIADEGGALGFSKWEELTGMSRDELEKYVKDNDNIKIHKHGDIVDKKGLSEDVSITEDVVVDEGKICAAGIAWAKRTYDKWPSAYASMGASKHCKKKGSAKKEGMEIEEGELKQWRDENWTQSDGTPCGDSKAQKNPKRCKPAAKWSGMSKGEKKADNAKKKAGGKKGKQFVSATKKGKVKGYSENMKITKSQLKQLIKEELEAVLDEEFLTELENDPRSKVSCREFLQKEDMDEAKTAAWQRKAGKNKKGGLNAKGRKSYEKANPGSDLKAPVSAKQAKKSKGGKAAGRRKSFCARMCGMKKKNTGAKGKRDPDSRINKSLRKWDCNC
tara:strand:- start:44 stop:1096 length:1053 start_codon:yes stop_codon:yes gene_type:complete